MKLPSDVQEELKLAGVRVVEKSGLFWNTLHWIVCIATFGANRRFRDGFVTTIGSVIGIPVGRKFTPDMYTTIQHEMVHVGQFRKMGFGSAWLGVIPALFWYVFFPLPIGFCWGRWQMERWAYLVNIRARRSAKAQEIEIAHTVDVMTTSAYGWTLPPFMWVKRYIARWLKNHV